MNCRHCAYAALLLTIGILAGEARGQGAGHAKAIPAPVTLLPAEYTSPTTAGIKAFVDPNVFNLLVDSDPVAQAKARDNLALATMTAGAPASPGFLLEYGKALDAAMLPELAPAAKASVRQRLNIAIVVQRVAVVAQNSTLQATTVQLMNDASEAVVLWALRAAREEVPPLLSAAAPGAVPPLIKAIAPAAMKNPSGPVYEEAYLALNVAHPLVVNELMTLWGSRLKKYKTETPDDPAVDGRPVYTLTTAAMWTTVIMGNKRLQDNIMQNVSDQLSVAAQWADKSPAGDTRDQLVKLVQLCSGGASVVGGHQKIPALVNAAAAGIRVDPKSWPVGQKLMPVVAPIIAEIATAFKQVQPPPVIAAGGGGGAP